MRARKRNNNNEEDNIHRWLISYSDFFDFFCLHFFCSPLCFIFHGFNKSRKKMTTSLRKVFKVIDEPISFEEDRNKAIIEDLRKLLNDVSGVDIRSGPRGIVITLPDILLFSSGSAELKPEAYEPLTRIAEKLKEIPGKISIEGHTDNIPISSSIYKSNWELSAARASSVLHFLLQKGLNPDRFMIAGYGEYRPIESNETAEGRAKKTEELKL